MTGEGLSDLQVYILAFPLLNDAGDPALEYVAADYAEWMDRHHLLHPEVRAMLAGLKANVLEQREGLTRYLPPFELPEADLEVVARLEQEIGLAAE